MRKTCAVCFCLFFGSMIPRVAAETPKDPDHPIGQAGPAVTSPTGPGERAPASDGTPAVVVDDNKVESLLGKVVQSASGEKLGPITDILVAHSGDVRAAVIDFGGFLGVGTRKVAVAWTALHFSPTAIALNMTRDELRVTPEYREGEPIVVVGSSSGQTSGSATSSGRPTAPK
jgi:hypothetical protein